VVIYVVTVLTWTRGEDSPERRSSGGHQRPVLQTRGWHFFASDEAACYQWVLQHQTAYSESSSEIYWPSGRRLSVKLSPTVADRGSHVVSLTDPYGHIPGFLDRSCYFFLQVAPQLYSRSWVDPAPDQLLLRKSGSRESNPDLWICSQELWPLDHRGGPSSSNRTIVCKNPFFLLNTCMSHLVSSSERITALND
jgi:hypothetical protein